MKQKLLLVIFGIMMALGMNAETLERTIYYSCETSKGQYFVNNYDILRPVDTPEQISGGYISSMAISMVKVDGTTVSLTSSYSATTSLGKRLYNSDLDINYHNTSSTNAATPISSATFSSNAASGSHYQYGFNIEYSRLSAKKYDIYGTIKFVYYSSEYTRTFHLSIYPDPSLLNAIRFVQNTSTTTSYSTQSTYVNKRLLVYTYCPYNTGTRIYTTNNSNATLSLPYITGGYYQTNEFFASKPGTYTIKVSAGAGGNSAHYFSSEATLTVNVIRRTPSFSFKESSVSQSAEYVRGKDIRLLNPLTYDGDGNVTYIVRNTGNGQLVTLTDNCLPEDLPGGTYSVTATASQTDEYNSATASYTFTMRDFPSYSCVKTIKTGEELDLKTFIKDYDPSLNATFACDDPLTTINGDVFTSNVEGEYFVNLTTDRTSRYESLNTKVRVIVCNSHEHGRINLHLHYDALISQTSTKFDCTHYCYIIPEWDFTADVSGTPVRFCINDDGESVTLVSGLPITYHRRNTQRYNKTEYDTHEHASHGAEKNYNWDVELQRFYYSEPFGIDIAGEHWYKHSTIPDLCDQNYLIYDQVAQFYNIEGDLEIPEKVTYNGKEYTVTKIGDCAFTYSPDQAPTVSASVTIGGDPRVDRFCAKITDLTLPSSITNIGARAFALWGGSESVHGNTNSRYVNSVNFSDLNNLERIEGYGFEGSNINSIDFTQCSKLSNIGHSAFEYCPELETVNMRGLQNFYKNGSYEHESNKDWQDVFGSCPKLNSLDVRDMPNLIEIGDGLCYGCTSLTLSGLKIDNTPIRRFGRSCFGECNFQGGTLDLRRLIKENYDDETPYPIFFDYMSFENTKVRSIICDYKYAEFNEAIGGYQSPTYIFMLHPDPFMGFYPYHESQGEKTNIDIFAPIEKYFDERDNFETWVAGVDIYGDDNGWEDDNHGPRVYPILRAKPSNVRTMSYFRPLDYKNIKVFDNTHLYDGDKADGTEYQLSDFFRTPENIVDNSIEILKPYTATGYNVAAKQVTMTALGDEKPGIDALGGIYYKGTGTAVDTDDNEVLYLLTEPEYEGSFDNKEYTNLNNNTNYLKGGGKDAVNMAGAPHMTDESTQFISKGGTFYYCTGGTLGAFKAYLDLPEFIYTAADDGYGSQLTKVSSLSFVWNDEEDDTATAVDAIKDNSPVTKDYFNMQGMKVKTPVSGGIYIHNGRKVLVK